MAASCGITSGRPAAARISTSRGSAIWNDTFLFLTPDNYMVALDARTGKELWHVEIADFNQQYFTTSAPYRHRRPRAGGHGQ